MHKSSIMANMVTPRGTPSPTPIFVDGARPSDDDGRLECDERIPVDVMVGAVDKEEGAANEEEGAADKEVVAVKSPLEVINAMTRTVSV